MPYGPRREGARGTAARRALHRPAGRTRPHRGAHTTARGDPGSRCRGGHRHDGRVAGDGLGRSRTGGRGGPPRGGRPNDRWLGRRRGLRRLGRRSSRRVRGLPRRLGPRGRSPLLHRGRRRCGSGLHGGRLGHGRRLLGRRLSGRRPRQERERVEVALGIGGRADAEVDVWPVVLGRPARTDRRDDRPFRHRRALRDPERAEVRERDGEPTRRLDRDRLAARRNRARERHDAAHGREHRRAGRCTDVDAAMLPARIRLRPVEGERLQDRPGDGPGPGTRQGREEEKQDRSEPPHVEPPPCCQICQPEGG